MKIKYKYYFIMFHEGLHLYLFGERGFHVVSVSGEKMANKSIRAKKQLFYKLYVVI